MKLFRYGKPGKERTAVIYRGHSLDVSGFTENYDEPFFENDGLVRLREYVKANHSRLAPVSAGERLGCPIGRPSKIVCIGLNYADHARETNAQVPSEPVIFLKSTTAIIGQNDDVIIPKSSVKTDWEVELGVVICHRASYLNESEAVNCIAGYVLHNDISEREFQLERNGTWDKGKGCDTFAPLGPYLVTTDEINDINNLRLHLHVNDQLMQNGTTSNLIFKIPYLISYVSQFMTLLPGDIISTGTPAGVGLGMTPPVYLKPGDIMDLEIEGLGSQRQQVKAWGKNNLENYGS